MNCFCEAMQELEQKSNFTLHNSVQWKYLGLYNIPST